MGQRLELQALLVELLGSNQVYFQPPPNIQMQYPCIVYQRDTIRTEFANDKPYVHNRCYQVTVITSDPDSDLIGKVAQLPMCIHETFFTADNLNHDIFRIFF